MDMQVVRALTNPTRIRILDVIAQGPTTPSQLVEILDERLSMVGYHVRVLRATGCVRQVRSEQAGPAVERTYELAPEATPTRHVAPARLLRPGFGHPPAAVVQSILERDMVNPGTDIFGEGKDQLSCASIDVDAQGWREISAAMAEAANRVSTALEGSVQRLDDGDEEAIRVTIALASFESGRRRAA